jgi:hypothetical protein
MTLLAKDAFRGQTLRIHAGANYQRDQELHSRMPRPKRFDRSTRLRGTSWDYGRSDELFVPSCQSGLRASITTTLYQATYYVAKSTMDAEPFSFSAPQSYSYGSHRHGAYGIPSRRDRSGSMQSSGSSYLMVDEADLAIKRSQWETCQGSNLYPDSQNRQETSYDRQSFQDSSCDEFKELYASTFRSATGTSFSVDSEEATDETYCWSDPNPGHIRLSDDEDRAYEDKKPAATSAPTKRDNTQQAPAIEIAPGHFAKLRGSAETLRAIQCDFIRPCSCLCCHAHLGCIHDASYVLCPDCLVVNPLEGSLGGSGGVGLGFKAGGTVSIIG